MTLRPLLPPRGNHAANVSTVLSLTFMALAANPGAAEPSPAAAPLVISCSKSVAPLLRHLVGDYLEHDANTSVEIREETDLGVFALLDKGQAAAAVSARPISGEEIVRFRRRLDREPVGIPIAIGSIAVVVHSDNSIESLTLEQIAGFFAGRTRSWIELGVMFEGVKLHGLDRTFQSRSVFLSRALPSHMLVSTVRQHSTTDQVLASVAADPMALGFCGLGIRSQVRIVPVATSEGAQAVAPNAVTLRNRNYPLAHYYYLYTAGQPVGPVKDFLTFVLSPAGQRVVAKFGSGIASLPFRISD